MLNNFFIYLAEFSLSLAVFALAYRLFFQHLTHFQWSRWYLICSLLLSISLPFISYTSLFSGTPWGYQTIGSGINLGLESLMLYRGLGDNSLLVKEPLSATDQPFSLISYIFLLLYLAGCCYKAWRLQQSIGIVYRLIKNNPKADKGAYLLIRSPLHLSAFSFLHYIFLPFDNTNLSKEELAQVLHHEQVHVKQRHTLDLLLFEVAEIFFWFHPAIYYLNSRIRELHEYIVDAVVSREGGSVKQYGELLLKLACRQQGNPIMNSFSNKQIFYRIKMLTQTKSNPMQKFKFLFAFPVLVLALVLCSFFEKDAPNSVALSGKPEVNAFNAATNDRTIRKISWLGNTVYSDAELSKAFGIKEGDPYNKEAIDSRLNYNPEGTDLSSIYMDNGYLFFSVKVDEVPVNKSVDLAITISEGPEVRIGQIIIKGNEEISRERILEKIAIKPGELFNRSRLIKSLQAINQTGHFNQETTQVNPIPDQAAQSGEPGGTVDLEYVLEEI